MPGRLYDPVNQDDDDGGIFGAVQEALSRSRQLSNGSAPLGQGRFERQRLQSEFQNAQRRFEQKLQAKMAGPGQSSVGSGQWKLGQAPSHHGWAGLTDPTKQWVLRTLGQFPELRFTSGFRSPAYNATIPGAAKNSGHTRGVKADFVASNDVLNAAARWLQQHGARTLLHDGGTGYHLDVSYDGLGL